MLNLIPISDLTFLALPTGTLKSVCAAVFPLSSYRVVHPFIPLKITLTILKMKAFIFCMKPFLLPEHADKVSTEKVQVKCFA